MFIQLENMNLYIILSSQKLNIDCNALFSKKIKDGNVYCLTRDLMKKHCIKETIQFDNFGAIKDMLQNKSLNVLFFFFTRLPFELKTNPKLLGYLYLTCRMPNNSDRTFEKSLGSFSIV